MSFHTPPVSRLLFCGPLPYSVNRERLNGDEFGQHKEEEIFLFLFLGILSSINGQEDWGALAGPESLTGRHTLDGVYLGLVCVLWFCLCCFFFVVWLSTPRIGPSRSALGVDLPCRLCQLVAGASNIFVV